MQCESYVGEIAAVESDELIRRIDTWTKIATLFSVIAAVVTAAKGVPWLPYVLAVVAWVLLSLWLLRVVDPRNRFHEFVVRTIAGEAGSGDAGPASYTVRQQRMAATALVLVSAALLVLIGWGAWSHIRSARLSRPKNPPALVPFAEHEFGIIVAEFTLGVETRQPYKGSADDRELIYGDLHRLLEQERLQSRVGIQRAGPIRDKAQAMKLTEQYDADLVVWGYVPHNHCASFRPFLTVAPGSVSAQMADPGPFRVEIAGENTVETENMLKDHVRAASAFVLSMFLLRQEQPGDAQHAVDVLDKAIDLIGYQKGRATRQSGALQQDLDYNLALLQLMRGRAYAALGQADKALEDYEDARNELPIRALAAIGNLYYAQFEFDTAQTYYHQIEYDWRGQYGLGVVAYQEKQYANSISHLKEALDIAQREDSLAERTRLTMLFALGMAYKQKGDWSKAESSLDEVCTCKDLPPGFRDGVCSELAEVKAILTEGLPTPTEGTAALLPTLLPTATPSLVLTLLPTSIPAGDAAAIHVILWDWHLELASPDDFKMVPTTTGEGFTFDYPGRLLTLEVKNVKQKAIWAERWDQDARAEVLINSTQGERVWFEPGEKGLVTIELIRGASDATVVLSSGAEE